MTSVGMLAVLPSEAAADSEIVQLELAPELAELWAAEAYDDLVALLLPRAAEGDGVAFRLLGICAWYGLGCHRDTHDGIQLLRNARAKGDIVAMRVLLTLLPPEGSEGDTDLERRGMEAALARLGKDRLTYRLHPMAFGPTLEPSVNLEYAFAYNRRVALRQRKSWAIGNAADLALVRPGGEPSVNLRTHHDFSRAALDAGNGLMLQRQAFARQLGLGQPANVNAAVALYQRAAEDEEWDALWEIGFRYIVGNGVGRDIERGLRLVEAPASIDPRRAYRIGELFHDGERVPKDMHLAFHWYQRASRLGHPHAASELGRFYENGWADLSVDDAEAERHFRLAANRGATWGAYNLARLLMERGGSAEESEYWMRIAALKGNDRALLSMMRHHALAAPQPAGSHELEFWIRQAIARRQHDLSVYAAGLFGLFPDLPDVLFQKASRLARHMGDPHSFHPRLQAALLPGAPSFSPDRLQELLESSHGTDPCLRAYYAMARLFGPTTSQRHAPQLVYELVTDPAFERTALLDIVLLHCLILYPEVTNDPAAEIREAAGRLASEPDLRAGIPTDVLSSVSSYAELLDYIAGAMPAPDAPRDEVPEDLVAVEMSAELSSPHGNRGFSLFHRPQFSTLVHHYFGGESFRVRATVNAAGEVSEVKVLGDAPLAVKRVLERVWHYNRMTPADDPAAPLQRFVQPYLVPPVQLPSDFAEALKASLL